MQKTRPTPQFLSETPSCEIPQGLERELCCVLTSELLGASSSCGLGLPFDMVENSRVMKGSIQTLTTWAKKFTNYRGIQDDVQQNSLSSFILKTHPKDSWLFYFVPESSGNFFGGQEGANLIRLPPQGSMHTQSLFSFTPPWNSTHC